MSDKLSNQIGTCVIEYSGKILSKNDACNSLCPSAEGEFCQAVFSPTRLTQDHCANISNTEGMVFTKNTPMGDTLVDVVTINDGTVLTSIYYPLQNHIQKQITDLHNYQLSKRELEVATLMINGFSNDQIAKNLFISKPTLKTHINKIYKKIPVDKIHILKDR